MNPITKIVEALGPASYVLQAAVASLIGAALLLAFIMGRRAARRRYFGRRDERAQSLRRQLPEILDGRILPEAWRRDPLDDRILEEILLDCLEVAAQDEAEKIRFCLRISGLLDKRIHQSRRRRGWRRLRTLVILGRMRCPEAIPALAEGLDDSNQQTAIAAARGLGRYAMPEAAEPILERLEMKRLRLPANVLQSVLYHCCRDRPSMLLRALHFTDDQLRPLLARVLAEVASAELGEDLVLIASDPLPEVRASAARAMAGARPRLALAALQQLAADSEWFVRLRAVVALGILQDPRSIPVLLETLCDPNRFVRLRAAGALSRLEGFEEEILERTVRTRDRYALQALVGEMQRSGAMLAVLDGLADPHRRSRSRRILLAAVRAGAPRLLLDAVVHHSNWRVRTQSARLLAESQEPEVLRLLRFYSTDALHPRNRVLFSWLERRLQTATGARSEPDGAAPSGSSRPAPRRDNLSPAADPALARENR
ncbi:MAG TPA: HEAT repeat domain-containing protein [Candidatus Acidoferrales bacterium]|nr:HEAT repeat domain-containing protein [Candidatus Acidoferrales bacterium]